MTVELVKKRVSEIDAIKDDDEAAHSREDSLWYSVLRAIANGSDFAKELAVEALKTEQIDFQRWCA